MKNDELRQMAHEAERQGYLARAARLYDACRPEANASVSENYGWSNGRAMLAEREGNVSLATELYDVVVDLFGKLETTNENSKWGLSNAAMWAAVCGEVGIAKQRLQHFVDAAGQDVAKLYEVPLTEALIAHAEGDLETAQQQFANAMPLLRVDKAFDLLATISGERAMVLGELGLEKEAIAFMRACATDQVATSYPVRKIPPTLALAHLLVGPGHIKETRDEAYEILRSIITMVATSGAPDMEWQLFSVLADIADFDGSEEASIALGKRAVIHIASMHEEMKNHPAQMRRDLSTRLRVHADLVARLVRAGRIPEATQVQKMMDKEMIFEILRRDRAADVRQAFLPMTIAESELFAEFDDIQRGLQIALENASSPPSTSSVPAQRGSKGTDAATRWLDNVFSQNGRHNRPKFAAFLDSEIEPPTGVARIRFAQAGKYWHVLLTTNTGQYNFQVAVNAPEMAAHIFAFRECILCRSQEWMPMASQLYDLLLGPGASALKDIRYLQFAPSGPLAYLPFAALHDGNQLLVERYAISIYKTAQTLHEADNPPHTWRIAMIGESGTTTDLRHVEDELTQIHAIQPNAKRFEPFSKKMISETVSSGTEIVHIAGHFRLEPARADLSYLQLPNNEKLTLAELKSDEYDFSRVELAVFSACETAVSDFGVAGLESLATLAQARGAQRVLGTLWPVSDKATAQFMAAFYHRFFLEKESGSIAEILRKTQMEIARGASESITHVEPNSPMTSGFSLHPYYWAGYVLHE